MNRKKMKGNILSALVFGIIIIFFAVILHMFMAEPLQYVYNTTSDLTGNATAVQAMARNVELFNMIPVVVFVVIVLAWILIAQRRSELDAFG